MSKGYIIVFPINYKPSYLTNQCQKYNLNNESWVVVWSSACSLFEYISTSATIRYARAILCTGKIPEYNPVMLTAFGQDFLRLARSKKRLKSPEECHTTLCVSCQLHMIDDPEHESNHLHRTWSSNISSEYSICYMEIHHQYQLSIQGDFHLII